MRTGRTGSSRSAIYSGRSFHTVVLVCLVAILSYAAAQLAGALELRPQMVWPLWPGCAILVAVLLLVPRRIWPVLIVAGFAGFVLYDLRVGLPLRSTALLVLSDTIEVLVATLGVSYCFDGVPRLNSVEALAKYSLFAVILAPLSAAFMGTVALSGDYWLRWRTSFFTESLALLTLTPAILSWVSTRQEWTRKSRAFYLEAAALVAGLMLLGYIAFVAPGHRSLPVLLYSLLPFLLWSALRFGSMGVSTAMIAVAFQSIWGAVHGRGPFTGSDPLDNVLSLQLFLFFAATPFMVLAALVEEQTETEQAFRESEKRFRLVADTAPALIWMSGLDKLCTYFNQSWLDYTGRSMEAELGNGWTEGVHSEDLQRCLETYAHSFDQRQKFRMEYRLRQNDGEYRWILDIGVPRFNADRSFAGYIGIAVDVTERKLAEEALSGVGRRLVQAQEQERTRIERELHDNINQRIAILAIELEQLEQSGSEPLDEVRSHIHAMRRRTTELGTEVQAISHRLHSSKLEYLGLLAAAASFCRELSEQQHVEVAFSHYGIPPGVPQEVSLCLFRVLQEALNNAVKHSGVGHFTVELFRSAEQIHLTVSDSGVGFDPELAITSKGLGLISMQERVLLLKGEFSIDSQPSRGTTVHARVPLGLERDSLRAAG